MATMIDGSKMKAAMKARGVSSQTLATMLGMSRQSISRILNGWQNPPADTSGRIAEALGVPLESICLSALELSELTREECEVVEAMRSLGRIGSGQIWAFSKGLQASGSLSAAEAASELERAAEESEAEEESRDDEEEEDKPEA
jgi:transcriptional regulator with XRE-family HTH domain